MGNTISDLTPTPLPANTVATSYNRNGNHVIQSMLGIGLYGIALRNESAPNLDVSSVAAFSRRSNYPGNIVASQHIRPGKYRNACILNELADYNLLRFYFAYSSLGISGLNEALAQTVAHQLLSALAYLHDKSFVHRDIKPATILVIWTSRSSLAFKLSDFGLAAHFLEDESVPAPVARYTAPELLLQGHDPQQVSKADVWALRMVCKDLCTQALLHPHAEGKALGTWVKETTSWRLREDDASRPTARECREAVWVRQGGRIPSGLLHALSQGLGLQSDYMSDEMEM